MQQLSPGETVAREGTFTSPGQIECLIRIVHSPIRYGTGDAEDAPEVANDIPQDTFYIWYGSTTTRDFFNASGGGYDSLSEALAAAEAAPGIGHTVRWK